MPVRIADCPPADRPRERLWRLGASALSDAELVALVLRQGRQGESAIELAASLVSNCGGLPELARREPEELAAYAGMGRAKSAALIAALELGGRLETGPSPPVVRSVDDLAAIASIELSSARRERALAIVLGPGHRVQRVVRVAEGSSSRAPMPVREVLNAVLRNDGVAFAVAHNHPSGDPTPSLEDRRATRRLMDAAQVVGLRFLDHVVVAAGEWRRADPAD